jgi:acetyl esterase/lipase
VSLAIFAHSSPDVADLGIDPEAGRQTSGCELHGTIAGSGHGEQERRAGPDAEDARAIDPRPGRRWRREDVRRWSHPGDRGEGAHAIGLDPRLGPIGVIVVVVVVPAIRHDQLEQLHAGEIHAACPRGVTHTHRAARPELPPIADQHELGSPAGAALHLVCHSPDDRVVPFSKGRAAHERLEAAGIDSRLLRYDGGHGPSVRLVHEVARWIDEASQVSPRRQQKAGVRRIPREERRISAS